VTGSNSYCVDTVFCCSHQNGVSALMVTEETSVASLLLDYGADVNLKSKVTLNLPSNYVKNICKCVSVS